MCGDRTSLFRKVETEGGAAASEAARAAEAAARAAEGRAAELRLSVLHGGAADANDAALLDADFVAAATGALVLDEYPPPRAGELGDAVVACQDSTAPGHDCALWASQGECVNNRAGLYGLCPKSCGWCDVENITARAVGQGGHHSAGGAAAAAQQARRVAAARWRRTAATGYGVGLEAPIQVLSWSPRAFLVPNLFTEAECDHLAALGKPKMQASQTSLETANALDHAKSKVRTSQSADLSEWLKADPVVRATEARIARFTRLPPENQEGYQLLHYAPGTFYMPHEDYFGPALDLYAKSGTCVPLYEVAPRTLSSVILTDE